jgi:hypothetical protein
MSETAVITVFRPRAEVQRRWQELENRPEGADATFADAPGDRGTEIHLASSDHPRAKLMDALRHFKQLTETGVIARSDAVPEGEQAERKLKMRPAQPLDESELEKAGA